MKSNQITSILYIIPGIEAYGGIQSHCADILAALAQIEGQKIIVLSKNDVAKSIMGTSKAITFVGLGKYPKFLRSVLLSLLSVYYFTTVSHLLILIGHAHFSPLGLVGRYLFNCRYLVFIYGLEVWPPRNRLVSWALKSAAEIISISNFTLLKLEQYVGYKFKMTSVLPCTVDGNRFNIQSKAKDLAEKYGISPEARVVLTLCRLESPQRQKGYDQVLAVMKNVRNRMGEVVYILAGAGPDRDRIERLVEELKLSTHVKLLGAVSDKMRAQLFNLCDLFIMPSKKEGFGIVYLEALACGVRVIAGRQDGGSEALREGELGTLVNSDDLHEIEDSICHLLSEVPSSSSMEDRSVLRENVLAYFGKEKFLERLSTILRRHLDR